MSYTRREGGSFLGGVVLGALIGGVVALVLAPQSGRETRQKLREWKEDNKDILADTKESTERMIAKAKTTIEELLQRLNKAMHQQNGKHSAYETEHAQEHV